MIDTGWAGTLPLFFGALREAGADACLVGETLMRAKDKALMLRELREA